MFRDAGFTGRYPLNGYTFRCSCDQLSRLPVYVLDREADWNRISRKTRRCGRYLPHLVLLDLRSGLTIRKSF